MGRFAVFVCSFGYVGFFPVAPGTAGSAAGVALYALLHYFGVTQLELPLAVAMFALGVWLGYLLFRMFGSFYLFVTKRFEIRDQSLSAYIYEVLHQSQ